MFWGQLLLNPWILRLSLCQGIPILSLARVCFVCVCGCDRERNRVYVRLGLSLNRIKADQSKMFEMREIFDCSI